MFLHALHLLLGAQYTVVPLHIGGTSLFEVEVRFWFDVPGLSY